MSTGIDFNQAKYHFKNAKSRFSMKWDWICDNVAEMIGEIDFIGATALSYPPGAEFHAD